MPVADRRFGDTVDQAPTTVLQRRHGALRAHSLLPPAWVFGKL